MLATYFLERAARHLQLPVRSPTRDDLRDLEAYEWPGNVRELQNVTERATIRAGSGDLAFDLAPSKLEREPSVDVAGPTPPMASAEIVSEEKMRRRDRENILAALHRTDWRVYGAGGAAELLGMKPSTLASRMKKLGLEKPT